MSSSRTGTGQLLAAGRWTNPPPHSSRSSDHAVGELQTPATGRLPAEPPAPAPPGGSPPSPAPPVPPVPPPGSPAAPAPPSVAPAPLVPPWPVPPLVPPRPARGADPPSPVEPPVAPPASPPVAPSPSTLSDFPAHDAERTHPTTMTPSARAIELLPRIRQRAYESPVAG